MPKGYIYADFQVTDPAKWDAYVRLTQVGLVGSGARFVVRSGDPEVLESDLGGRGVAILEFESRAGDVMVLLLSNPEA
jgi:uncharacterized protein (DUF1330 family)